VLDTAVSYRAQRSEITLGQALADLTAAGDAKRDELIIASKGGFITYRITRPAHRMQYIYDNFIAPGVCEAADFAGGIHCIAPDYLSQQITWSLRNTGLRAIDIYYLHDPETQLAFVDRTTFRHRLQLAFARLEEEVAAGRIGCYGVATWHGLRRAPMAEDYVSLEVFVKLAREVAGEQHHLHAVQFPLSAAMPDAIVLRNQPVGKTLMTCVAAARELGLTVFTSASMMQALLLDRLPHPLAEAFPQFESNAQRALHFARSVPGVTTVLAGMRRTEHVRENLALLAHPPEPEKAERVARSLR
jgi:aryl-alcohol dehydrogenase-like predicted oxidoreductase